MPEIIIAGGGHGGLITAIKLGKKGYKIKLFEQRAKEDLGLMQTDAVDISAFTYADIDILPSFKTGKNEVTFVPLEQELGSLTLPPQSETSVFIDRREFINYLFSLAEESGVEIRYNECVKAPIILGNRVCGIETDKGKYYCDLVVDACGVNSPVRNGLPNYMGVNRPIKKYDVLYSYRGYFNKVEDAPAPKTDYNLFLKDNGTVGFRWLITEENRVDALICRFYKPTDSEISATLYEMHTENAQMGSDLIYGGSHNIIPVCQPLAVMVADGYAAVGDSAFMTVAVKGSGIAYSMKAGTMLADAVLKDIHHKFNRETLWEYQKRFFKEIGSDAGGIAVCKNLLPYMLAEDVNKLFKLGLVSTDEIATLWEHKADAIFNSKGLNTIKEKVRLVRDEPRLKELFGNIAVWMGKYAVLQAFFPNKYDEKEIDEWVERYNKFFDSIRYEG